MNKLFQTLMTCAALTSVMSFSACSDDDTPQTPPGGGEGNANLIGSISGVRTLSADTTYTLTGTLIVAEGGTLNIPAGTTIKAKSGFASYILVDRGGKIFANGTADAPITFEADAENAGSGYWGGLIINGRAPISGESASGNEGATEINNEYRYGGTNPGDNSGVLSYVQIFNSGARSSGDIEHNGLTLNAVGSGTQISNIYIADGADDAIEFFGGSVNVSNLLAVNCEDDMFDFTQGYCGTLSNCYGVWESSFVSDEEDPRGVEADGNLDGDGPTHTPQSNFRIENMTIENLSTAAKMVDAIKVRRGATATIVNALVKGNGQVADLVDLTDSKGDANAATSIQLTNQLTTDFSGNEVNGTGNVTVEPGNTGANTANLAWTGYEFAGSAASDAVALSGTINSDMTLDASKEYIIDGSVVVADGATLTIPAGMTIKARKGFANYLLVDRGGKLIAQGTADAPIVFRAEADNAGSGYWGGIIINGRAPISGDNADGNNEGATEINNDYRYGGTDAADNSGVLTYVSILNSGARSSGDIEHNGLTLNAVGNGTQIENIYIADGADDAIEFFGGSVNVTNLLAVNCEDDMFDFTQGYCGTLANCHGIWEEGFISDEEDPRGVEADGNLDGNGPTHTPQSNFTINGMTIETRSEDCALVDAIKVRRGAKATIQNAVVKGQGLVEDLVDLTDSKGTGDAASTISVSNELGQAISGSETKGDGQINVASGNTGADDSVFGWSGYTNF